MSAAAARRPARAAHAAAPVRCRACARRCVFGVLARRCSSVARWRARCTCSGSTTISCRSRARRATRRELEVPAHRGRIVDRFGEPLAISTPVKSLWAFPRQVRRDAGAARGARALLETTPQTAARRRLDASEDFVFVARQIAPETAERAMALRIKGLNDQNEYRRYYPGGDVTAHIVGFTGDDDVGPGRHRARAAGLARRQPGSRRVIINRRGERSRTSRRSARRRPAATSRCRSTRGCSTSRSAS